MGPGKRKRGTDYPRITYHASGRTFDRLFKGNVVSYRVYTCHLIHHGVEESLKEMKEIARTKLGIPPNAVIVLEQIRDGQPIDLEDGEAHHPRQHVVLTLGYADDDFDAFYSVAHSTSIANVRVSIGTPKDQVLPATLVSAPT